jgi:hypothetical protein
MVQPADVLTLAYEALRAQAVGALPASTPRGLALLLTAGLPAWMTAWKPFAPAVATTASVPHDRQPSADVGGDVVQLLAEMALGRERRSTT